MTTDEIDEKLKGKSRVTMHEILPYLSTMRDVVEFRHYLLSKGWRAIKVRDGGRITTAYERAI